MNKLKKIVSVLALAILAVVGETPAQADIPQVNDVVLLRDGSRLNGVILQWDLATGMKFRLLTGAEVIILKKDIRKVAQQVPFVSNAGDPFAEPGKKQPGAYSFREKGLYSNISVFLHNSRLYNGTGMQYAMGHRFNRLIGLGGGLGYESNDIGNGRNFIPFFAEIRGFAFAQKITPYYAVKAGYAAALRNEEFGIERARGGFYFSPEAGVRFGGGNQVSFYLGLEYKLQNASFVQSDLTWWGPETTFTDKVSYRRVELRTGILF